MLSIGQGKQAFLKGPRIQPDSKFRQRYVGPFVIKGKISRNAYLLELPRSWEAHPVFHVSRLKPWKEGERIRRTIPATRPQPVRKTQDTIEIFASGAAKRNTVGRLRTGDPSPLSEVEWPTTLTDSSFPCRAIV